MVHNTASAMRSGRTAILVSALLMVLTLPLAAQSEGSIPSTISLNTIYEGTLFDGAEHSLRLPGAGTYVLFAGVDSATEVEIELPGRRAFVHVMEQVRGNFVVLDVSRAGTATFTFSPLEPSEFGEPFYGLLVTEAVGAPLSRPLTGDLSGSILETPGDAMYLQAFLLEVAEETNVAIVAEGMGFGFSMILGSEDDFTAESSYYHDNYPEDAVVIETTLQADRTYVLMITAETGEDVPTQYRITFDESEVVAVDPIPLELGQSVEETLTGDLPFVGGKRAIPFYYEGRLGQEVAVLLESDEIDSYLIVETPSGTVLTDDDGAYDRNSLIVFEIEERGRYTIYASSYSGAELGSFRILLDEPEVIDQIIADAYGDFPDEPPYDQPDAGEDYTARVTPIAEGDRLSGMLDTDSSVRYGSYVEIYELDLSGGQDIVIDLISDDFDAFLTVVTPDGTELTDDDGGSNTNSSLQLIDADGGTYEIWAGSYFDSGFGSFEISVESFTPGPQAEEAEPIMLREGRPAEGRITSSSPQFDGDLVEVYAFRADRGVTAIVTHVSDDFDSYLYVVAPDGTLLTDDDSAGDLDSRIIIDRTLGGTYRVYAGSFGGSGTGALTLSLEFDNVR